MMRRLFCVLALLWLAPAGPTSADTLLDGGAEETVVQVARGSQVELVATFQNWTQNIIYLRSLSYAATDTLIGTVSISPFFSTAPDSLAPGEGWEGVIAVVDVPGGPGTSSQHRLEFDVMGGVTPFDNQLVAMATFVLDDSNVTTAAPPPQPTAVGLALAVIPNPALRSARAIVMLPAPGTVNLRVYDVLGRTRRVLASGPETPGTHAYEWDGRDATGHDVGPGVYFLSLVTPQGARRVRLVRTR